MKSSALALCCIGTAGCVAGAAVESPATFLLSMLAFAVGLGLMVVARLRQ